MSVPSSRTASSSSSEECWRGECAATEARFLRHFEQLGYQRHPEEPLLPRTDRSLLFTNAFIVALKPLLRSGGPSPRERLVMRQSCLRTQNLDRGPEDESPLAYSSRFDMVGGLVGAELLPGLLKDLDELFVRALEVPAERLFIKASRSTPFFPRHAATTPWAARTLLDTEPERYYQWGYGEPGLTGIGVTFALAPPLASEPRDFGNIVELTYQGRTVGYEFGFGVETFVCRRHGLRNPMQASLVSALMPEWSSPRYDFTKDLILIAHTAFHEGIRAGKGGARHVLKKACRLLARQLDAGRLAPGELELALRRLGGVDVELFMSMFNRLRRQPGPAADAVSPRSKRE